LGHSPGGDKMAATDAARMGGMRLKRESDLHPMEDRG
jgi:hypothetical protein